MLVYSGVRTLYNKILYGVNNFNILLTFTAAYDSPLPSAKVSYSNDIMCGNYSQGNADKLRAKCHTYVPSISILIHQYLPTR